MSESGTAPSDLILGIDLGTTNSEVAAFVDGKVTVLVRAERICCPLLLACPRPAICWWVRRRAIS